MALLLRFFDQPNYTIILVIFQVYNQDYLLIVIMADINITNPLENQELVRDMKRLLRHLLRKGNFPKLNDKTIQAVYAMSQCLFLSYVAIDSRQNGVHIAYTIPDAVTKAGKDFIGWKDE